MRRPGVTACGRWSLLSILSRAKTAIFGAPMHRRILGGMLVGIAALLMLAAVARAADCPPLPPPKSGSDIQSQGSKAQQHR